VCGCVDEGGVVRTCSKEAKRPSNQWISSNNRLWRAGGIKLNTSFYGAIPRYPCYTGGARPNVTGAGNQVASLLSGLGTVRVFDRNVHSRMPLVPTSARLKLLHACGQ
jgi:hypothetical protein